jgi:orotate phosphoribosyltransferase
LADLIEELVRAGDFQGPEVIVAVEGSGIVLGVAIAKELGKPFAAVRPQRSAKKKASGLVNPSFHGVSGKRALIVDAVLREGGTHKAAVQTLREAKAKPVGVLVLVNKSGKTKLDGLPLKSLIQLLPVSPS